MFKNILKKIKHQLRSKYKRLFHRWYGWHSLYMKFTHLTKKNIPLRRKFAKVVAIFLPKSTQLIEGDKYFSIYSDLNSKGYSLLDNLSNNDFKTLSSHLLKAPVRPGQSGNDSIKSSSLKTCRKNYPKENLFQIPLSELVKSPLILELANSKNIINPIGSYLGCKPTLFNIVAWWSLPVNKEPLESQNFHRDWDDLKFVKCFIYITDVDDDNGPHIYVENTHNSKLLNRNRRFSDEEVKRLYPENNIVKFTGKGGSIFLEDTAGIHKGSVPVKNKRLILQFLYSLLPVGDYPLPKYKFSDYNRDKVDDYISRFYIKK